jgi:hypothetical protein
MPICLPNIVGVEYFEGDRFAFLTKDNRVHSFVWDSKRNDAQFVGEHKLDEVLMELPLIKTQSTRMPDHVTKMVAARLFGESVKPPVAKTTQAAASPNSSAPSLRHSSE